MAYMPDENSAALGHGHVAHAVDRRGERLVPVVNLLSLHVNQQLLAEVIGSDNTWLEHDQLKLNPTVSSDASKNTVQTPMAQNINRRTTTIFFNGGSFTIKEVAGKLVQGLRFKGHMNASGCTLSVSNLELRQVLLLGRKLSGDIDVWMWCGAVFGSHQDFCQAVSEDMQHEVRLHCESVRLCAYSNIEMRLQSHHVH